MGAPYGAMPCDAVAAHLSDAHVVGAHFAVPHRALACGSCLVCCLGLAAVRIFEGLPLGFEGSGWGIAGFAYMTGA